MTHQLRLRLRALLAAALATGTLASASPATAAESVSFPLHQAVDELPLAAEEREGYDRSAFRHWVDADRDGCTTRAEVLKRDATTAPQQAARCALSGGSWHSWYDETTIDGPRGIDIDHMVPLAEAWDSGASSWTAARREAFANDLGDVRALQAVSARSNRSKADRDPAEWMPPADSATCRYVADWAAIKHRWQLNVDNAELNALQQHAADCPNQSITVELAP